MCRICFTQAEFEDFETSGAAGLTVAGDMSSCCGSVLHRQCKQVKNLTSHCSLAPSKTYRYGSKFDGETAANGNSAYDCLVIPHAETDAGLPAHGVSLTWTTNIL